MVTVPPRAPIDLVVSGALGLLFLVDESLSVGDGYLIVVWMNFAEGKEAVAVATVIDESGLERGLHARHFRQIDIAS